MPCPGHQKEVSVSVTLIFCYDLGRARLVRRQFLALKITGSTPVAQGSVYYCFFVLNAQ